MANELFYRDVELDERAVDSARRMVPLSCSSETAEVKRWFGTEVLSHHPEHVRMKRSLSLLFNHDRSAIIGPMKNMKIEGGMMRGEGMFDETEEGELRMKQVMSGSLKGTSLGYMVHKFRELAEGEQWQCANGKMITGGGKDNRTYVAVDWEPAEVTLTPVPADPSVGVGRELSRSLDGIAIEAPLTEGANQRSGDSAPENFEGGTQDMADETRTAQELETALRARDEEHRRGLESIFHRAAAVGMEALAFKLIIEGKDERAITDALFAEMGKERGKPQDGGDGTDNRGADTSLDGVDDETLIRGLCSPSPVKLD